MRHASPDGSGSPAPIVRGGVVALAVVAALGGCAGPVLRPDASIALEVPTAWSGAARPATGRDRAALPAWWRRFDDPLLAVLVGRALEANPSVASARAALRQARALRDAAAAGLLPVADASASGRRDETHGGGSAASAGNRYTLGLDASWEPDLFGAARSALDASEATARASAASLGDVQVSVAAETALAFIALRAAQARLAIAEANLEIQQETLQIAAWRRMAGLGTELEVEQARTIAEQTRSQRPALQTSIEQGRHALAVLTGRPPAALVAELGAASPVPQPAADLALGIPAETLRQRPDVRAAEQLVQAAAARVAVADAARRPSLRLGGSIGLSALTAGALLDGASVAGSLLASVTLPVFDGGARRAQVRAQTAAFDQAGATYRGVVLGALRDVEDALVALRGDRERLAHLQQAADAAGNAALLARQRYASGLVDFQVVLETQRTRLSTQDSVASAGADVSADHVRLYKALGGGWQAEAADGATADATPPT